MAAPTGAPGTWPRWPREAHSVPGPVQPPQALPRVAALPAEAQAFLPSPSQHRHPGWPPATAPGDRVLPRRPVPQPLWPGTQRTLGADTRPGPDPEAPSAS